jgi:hypothetical protein
VGCYCRHGTTHLLSRTPIIIKLTPISTEIIIEQPVHASNATHHTIRIMGYIDVVYCAWSKDRELLNVVEESFVAVESGCEGCTGRGVVVDV